MDGNFSRTSWFYLNTPEVHFSETRILTVLRVQDGTGPSRYQEPPLVPTEQELHGPKWPTEGCSKGFNKPSLTPPNSLQGNMDSFQTLLEPFQWFLGPNDPGNYLKDSKKWSSHTLNFSMDPKPMKLSKVQLSQSLFDLFIFIIQLIQSRMIYHVLTSL